MLLPEDIWPHVKLMRGEITIEQLEKMKVKP